MKKGRIIALSSQKGGSGKTTVAMQLAAGLARQRLRVAVADLDPQQSASRWAESAPPGQPFPAEVVLPSGPADELERDLRASMRNCDVLILDCPPSIEHPLTAAALDLAGVAVVPVVPSPTDLWSTRAIERLILDRQLRGALLPNRVTRTALADDVLEVMQDFELPVLDAALSQRSAYALSAVRGGSVFDLGRNAQAAREEVERLVAAILTQLEN